jgi:DMSO reductase family type II enzyme chaperone
VVTVAEAHPELPEHAPEDVDPDAGARGALYGLLARCFRDPDEQLHAALVDGSLAAEVETLLDRTSLSVDPPDLRTDRDHEALCALYNDLFVVGFSRTVDRTDGTVDSEGPPVPLYESAYRTDVSWSDVNLDLSRAYEHFGVEIAGEDRQHHDHLPLVLEFAGYLCRREAAVDPGVAQARLDLHDRHLRTFASGIAERVEGEPSTGVYGELAALLDRFTAADVEALAAEGDR